jgi:hypothetical protein
MPGIDTDQRTRRTPDADRTRETVASLHWEVARLREELGRDVRRLKDEISMLKGAAQDDLRQQQRRALRAEFSRLACVHVLAVSGTISLLTVALVKLLP